MRPHRSSPRSSPPRSRPHPARHGPSPRRDPPRVRRDRGPRRLRAGRRRSRDLGLTGRCRRHGLLRPGRPLRRPTLRRTSPRARRLRQPLLRIGLRAYARGGERERVRLGDPGRPALPGRRRDRGRLPSLLRADCRRGASRAILVTYLVPSLALVYGAALLDESISALAVVGLALVLSGVALGTRRAQVAS